MDIQKYVLGPLQTNTYLLSKDDEVIVIDPASKVLKLIELINNRKLVGILLTHGHFDHVKAVDGLYKEYHCLIYLKKDDAQLTSDKKFSNLFGHITSPTIDLNEGELKVASFDFEVYFTPGHTEGSVVYKIDKALFTGDTLFKSSVGRTDLYGGNSHELKDSLRLFKSFKENYIIYPGHDEITDLETELNYNPFLN